MIDWAVKGESLVKKYGKTEALSGLNISIPKNKIVGILGPNGCGKSTLFRTITGLVKPDQGSIEVLGKEPGWQTNSQIAYLPDRARWYPHHTVNHALKWAENFLPGFDRQSAEKLAAYMDMDLDMPAKGMSRGQEARLMLILCVAREIPLIVLDEPFSGIDVISREHIIEGIIEFLGEREQTILISTHEIHEIEGMFEYIVLMDKGKAVWAGDTEELRMRYGSMHSVFRSFYKRSVTSDGF
ncbi:MAG: ABC transporter ATP-binding protein [Tuberibacillus sp.]